MDNIAELNELIYAGVKLVSDKKKLFPKESQNKARLGNEDRSTNKETAITGESTEKDKTYGNQVK